MDIKTIPQREELPVEDTWKLEDIYPTDQAWQQDFDAAQAMAKRLPEYQGRLGSSGETLL